MLVTKLIDVVKLQGGQYFLDDFDIDITEMKDLLEKQVLPVFGRYLPVSEYSRFSIQGSPKTYTGTDVPQFISRVTPNGNFNVSNMLSEILTNRIKSDVAKPKFLWRYRIESEIGKLYMNWVGDFEAELVYSARLDSEVDDDTSIEKYDSRYQNYLVDLALAQVLIAVGKGRRIAKIADIPIDLDASEMVQEGTELWKETIQEIKEISKGHLAIG